ncbi:hypothetical protein OL230_12025 [Capnocytophaga ochracea]|uniref:hypothetical protein n=1 Tax=Capnocytophaga ochracea TaxID=1018 RepID=UPI002230B43E|nr:hypothetical protein [Capnocytophaga ochracea]UZD38568.1 hypothetical protein OL230_12025 [Capnocytophaga ochracea]
MKKILSLFFFVFVLLHNNVRGQEDGIFLTGNTKYQLDIVGYMFRGEDACGDVDGLKSIDIEYEDGTIQNIYSGRKIYESVIHRLNYSKRRKVTKVKLICTVRWKTFIGCNGGPSDRPLAPKVNGDVLYNRYDEEWNGLNWLTIDSKPVIEFNFSERDYYELGENKRLQIKLSDDIDERYITWKYQVGNGTPVVFFPEKNNKYILDVIAGVDFLKKEEDAYGKRITVWAETGHNDGTNLARVYRKIDAYNELKNCEEEAKKIPMRNVWDMARYIALIKCNNDYEVKLNSIDNYITQEYKNNYQTFKTKEKLAFWYYPSAPSIKEVKFSNPKCPSDKIKVTLVFDRKLKGDLEDYKKFKRSSTQYLGEKFNKLLLKASNGSSVSLINDDWDINEALLTSSTIELPIELEQGDTYTAQLMGDYTYKKNDGTIQSHQLYIADKSIITPKIRPLSATIEYSPVGNRCYGEKEGHAGISVRGGTPPYKYREEGKEGIIYLPGPFIDFRNKPTGTYTLTITDKNDCQILKNGEVSPVVVKIGGPTVPITIVNEGEVDFVKHASGYKKSDGSITTIITGGTPKNAFMKYIVKIESDKGMRRWISLYDIKPSTRGFKSTFNNLRAGTYTLTIIDGNDCTLTRKITITEPDELIINSIEATPISCNPRNSDPNNNSSINSNGTLTVNAKGGVPTYRYVWKRFNKPYTETRNKTITDLVDGIYQVEVIDANENKAVGTYTLTYPDPLYLKVTKSEMTCSAPNGGQATAIASGGTPPYTYLWNTGHTGAHITGLSAGKYFVTVSDSRGCSVQEKVMLSYPEEVEVVSTIITPATCYEGNDGKITLTLSGGKGAINVLWYDAEGTLITQGTTNGGKTISGLKAGKYKAVFRDQSDCPALEQFYEVLQPEKTVVNIPSQITICQGDSRSFDLSTAFPSATFRWTDSTGSLLSTEPTFTVSTKGNYKVEITGQKGCKEATTFEVSQSDKILEVDFLAATNSYYNYTVKLVSLSHSITTQWVLPREVTLIREENGAAEVRFPNEGTYTIGLKGFLDGCEKTVYKTLWVEKDRLGIGKENTSKEVLIDDFGIFSNPNNGTFRIKVNLKRASVIKVYCIDILGREAFPAIEQPEGTTFDIPIENRRISAGQYLVILEAGGDVMVQKMIVNH